MGLPFKLLDVAAFFLEVSGTILVLFVVLEIVPEIVPK